MQPLSAIRNFNGQNSTHNFNVKASLTPSGAVNHPKAVAKLFLKIPTQAAGPGKPLAATSVLHYPHDLNNLLIDFLGCPDTTKAFIISNSSILFVIHDTSTRTTCKIIICKNSLLHVMIIYSTIVKPQFISAEPYFINNTNYHSLDNGPYLFITDQVDSKRRVINRNPDKMVKSIPQPGSKRAVKKDMTSCFLMLTTMSTRGIYCTL